MAVGVKKLMAVPAILLGTIFLAACSGATPPTPSSSAAVPSTTVQDPASIMSAKVKTALEAVAGQNPKPSQEQVRTALQALAAAPSDVEVSISTTPTGLEVDAIQGSVKVDTSCVIGQVRDGQVVMTTLPVLQTGLCFVGDQR